MWLQYHILDIIIIIIQSQTSVVVELQAALDKTKWHEDCHYLMHTFYDTQVIMYKRSKLKSKLVAF